MTRQLKVVSSILTIATGWVRVPSLSLLAAWVVGPHADPPTAPNGWKVMAVWNHTRCYLSGYGNVGTTGRIFGSGPGPLGFVNTINRVHAHRIRNGLRSFDGKASATRVSPLPTYDYRILGHVEYMGGVGLMVTIPALTVWKHSWLAGPWAGHAFFLARPLGRWRK